MKLFNKSFITGLCLAFIFILQSAAIADTTDTIPEIVLQALKNTQSPDEASYAYTKTVNEAGKVKVERYEPSMDPAWTLLQSNGQAPTSDELQAYQDAQKSDSQKLEDKDQSKSDKEEKSFSFNFEDPSSVAESGSWKLLEENADESIYQFKPKIMDAEDRKILPYIDGKLYINNKNKTVKTYELTNPKPFKPVLVAKIHKFLMRIDFSEIDSQVFFPTDIKINIEGKAMFKRFKEVNLVTYSEFKKVN